VQETSKNNLLKGRETGLSFVKNPLSTLNGSFFLFPPMELRGKDFFQFGK
jgi:hypothetical protein